MCVRTDHMLLVIPLAECGIGVEVDEHYFEDGAIDNTVEYA